MTNEPSVLPPDMIDPQSPQWSRNTRRVIAVIMAVIVIAVLWRFQSLLAQVVLAWLVAYLLNPVINAITQRFPRLTRTAATLIVYIALVLILLSAIGLIGVAVVSEVGDLIKRVPSLIDDVVSYVGNLTNNPDAIIRIGSYEVINLSEVDWQQVQDNVLQGINPASATGGAVGAVGTAGAVVGGGINVVGTFFLTLIISIYLALDLPRFGRQWEAIADQSGYKADFDRIRQELLEIGNAYLRGQAILGLVVGVLTSVLLGLLGVQNALALGVLSGILEFIPYFGPIISAVVAVVVAFFQPTNYLGWGQVEFAIATLVVMILIQQIENTFLVPRIVGDALNLKPLTVMIAVIMGGALFGLLGIVLAGPVAAAIKLLGGYIWRKMLGLPPFPPEAKTEEEEHRTSLLGRTLGMIRSRRAHPENVPVPGNPARTVDVTPPGEGDPPPAAKA